jgi:hypothetical protein
MVHVSVPDGGGVEPSKVPQQKRPPSRVAAHVVASNASSEAKVSSSETWTGVAVGPVR